MKPFEQRYVGYYLDLVRSDPEDWRSITAELGQIRRAWELAAQDPGLVLGFVEALRPYQDRQGLWREELDWWQGRGLAAARALGLRRDEATLLNNIGTTYRSLGDLQNAADYYLQSFKIFKELDDTVGQAALLHNVGTALHASGDLAQALHCYQIALPMRRAAGDKAGEASTLNNIGSVYSEMDEPQRALEQFAPNLPVAAWVVSLHGPICLREREAACLLADSLSIGRALGSVSATSSTMNGPWRELASRLSRPPAAT